MSEEMKKGWLEFFKQYPMRTSFVPFPFPYFCDDDGVWYLVDDEKISNLSGEEIVKADVDTIDHHSNEYIAMIDDLITQAQSIKDRMIKYYENQNPIKK